MAGLGLLGGVQAVVRKESRAVVVGRDAGVGSTRGAVAGVQEVSVEAKEEENCVISVSACRHGHGIQFGV